MISFIYCYRPFTTRQKNQTDSTKNAREGKKNRAVRNTYEKKRKTMECINIHMFNVATNEEKKRPIRMSVVVSTVCARTHGKKLNNFNLQLIKLTKI